MRLAAVWFPNSRVASDGELVSPISYSGGAPAPFPNDASPGQVPAGGDSPWIVPVPSEEQGVGRSPGHQWPWRVHAETYNFDQLAIMPFEHEQTYGTPDTGGYGETGREHRIHGFMPGDTAYYEENLGIGNYLGVGQETGVAVLEDPQSAAFTVGWGSMDTAPSEYGY